MPKTIIVALSFDDGLEQHYYIAKELYRLGISATFFIITHLKRHPDWPNMPLLKKEQIQAMRLMGHEIASHSALHRDLTRLNKEELFFEIRDSKISLENILGQEVVGFAYPYGLYTHSVKSIVEHYYDYARSLYLRSVKTCSSSYNKQTFKYALCSFTPKAFVAYLFHSIIHKGRFPYGNIIVFHKEPLSEIYTLLRTLKLVGAKFCSIKDLVRYLC